MFEESSRELSEMTAAVIYLLTYTMCNNNNNNMLKALREFTWFISNQ